MLLIHRTAYRDLTLPKGKVDPGETLAETAAREIFEETGIHVSLGIPVGVSRYRMPNKREKIVHYWSAEATDVAIRTSAFVPNREIAAIEWMSPKKALKRLSYPVDVEILENFLRFVDDGVLAHLPADRAAPREGALPRRVEGEGCRAPAVAARPEAGERRRRTASRLRTAEDRLVARHALHEDGESPLVGDRPQGRAERTSSARTRGRRANRMPGASSESACGAARPPCCAAMDRCSPTS